MKPLIEFDEQHVDRMRKSIIASIMDCGYDANTQTIILRNAEVCRALTSVMAAILSGSPEAKTAQGLKRIAERFAKDLRKDVLALRDQPSPFEAISQTNIN
jgi:hypothetical protein